MFSIYKNPKFYTPFNTAILRKPNILQAYGDLYLVCCSSLCKHSIV